MRKRLWLVGVAAALGALSLTACQPGPTYDAYCIDRYTQIRTFDYNCNNSGSYYWYYIPAGNSIPRIGAHASSGSTKVPDGTVYRGGLSTTGGKAPTSAPKGSTKVSTSKAKSTPKPTSKKYTPKSNYKPKTRSGK